MEITDKKTLKLFLEYIPIWIGLTMGRLMPFRMRSAFFALIGGWVVPIVPGTRRRVISGLKRVFPDMPEEKQQQLCKEIGRNTGRTLSEILFNASYKKQTYLFDATGPGLNVLRSAKKSGKGVIMVSAHYGQWEAIRHCLKSIDMETGAVYRENNNPWYEQRFLAGIKEGGLPIVAKGAKGNLKMVKHLRKGGFFALLVDQKFHSGELIPFLGIDALTTTSPAELALRYDLPLVPVFGTRDKNGYNIHVEIETPIEHTDALTMTREVNERIGARILANPEQWYWLHKRWEDTHLYDLIHGNKS